MRKNTMKIEWKRKTGSFENGIKGYLGKIPIGSVDWDSCTSDNNLLYNVNCTLPMVKQFKNCATEEEGKENLINAINQWIAATGITEEKVQ